MIFRFGFAQTVSTGSMELTSNGQCIEITFPNHRPIILATPIVDENGAVTSSVTIADY